MGASVIVQTPDRMIESRANVENLETLHSLRRDIMAELAPLRALHGPGGTWDHRRKHLLEVLKVRHRETLTASSQKATDAMVDAMAHADPDYEQFIEEGESEKIRYVVLENEKDDLDDRIYSRGQEMNAWAREAGMPR